VTVVTFIWTKCEKCKEYKIYIKTSNKMWEVQRI